MTKSTVQRGQVARRLELLLSRAVARQTLKAAKSDKIIHRAQFVPLAAQNSPVNIYGEISARNDTLLRVRLEAREHEIRVTIRSIGFARSQMVMRRAATFRTSSGLITYDFRFDDQGLATFSLKRSGRIEEELREGYDILVFQ